MMKFLRVLAINCLIGLIQMSTVWVSAGIVLGLACTYSHTIAELLRVSPEQEYMLHNGGLISLIAFAIDGFYINLMLVFPISLAVTLGLDGKIAYTQTLAKSQRGRDFVERLKSLDAALSAALRKLFERRSEEDL